MALDQLQLDLSRAPSGLSLSGKIAESLAFEIRRGRLVPGSRIPSSRRLAAQLGVHRNTVLAAIDDLVLQGYVRTEPARGVYVSERLSRNEGPNRRSERTVPVDFPLADFSVHSSVVEPDSEKLQLMGGLPDLRLVPVDALARAYRLALRKLPETLDYRSPLGQSRFLKAFSRFLAETRGVIGEEGELLSTRGSQQALFLAGGVLCRPGHVIAVERLGYPPAWDAFTLAGAHLVPVSVDEGGIVVEDLERISQRYRLAAVYVTPHHQYPTTVTMSAPRRQQLLELAKKRRFFVIEDDYDHEFHFAGRPVLPLASADEARVVIHIGSLSKVFAPGIRLGYAVAQKRIIAKMAAMRQILDRQGDHVFELALAYMIEDGEFAAHLRRMHRTYEERRAALFHELHVRLADRLKYEEPTGGLAVWARVRRCGRSDRGTAEHWAENAQRAGVMVQPGRHLSFDGRARSFLRIGYPRLAPQEIRQAVLRLEQAYPRR